MAGRTVTIELTEDQAALLDEIAAGRETTPDKLLLDAIAHGLAMIAAGVDESDLVEPWDRPGADQSRLLPTKKMREAAEPESGEIPF